jgi:hypothetical protein
VTAPLGSLGCTVRPESSDRVDEAPDACYESACIVFSCDGFGVTWVLLGCCAVKALETVDTIRGSLLYCLGKPVF